MKDWKERAKIIKPISLNELKKIKKEDCIKIILTREIAFNKIREEWSNIVNKNTKEEFRLRNIEFKIINNKEFRDSKILTYDNLKLIDINQKLIEDNKKYVAEIERLEEYKDSLIRLVRELNKERNDFYSNIKKGR